MVDKWHVLTWHIEIRVHFICQSVPWTITNMWREYSKSHYCGPNFCRTRDPERSFGRAGKVSHSTTMARLLSLWHGTTVLATPLDSFPTPNSNVSSTKEFYTNRSRFRRNKVEGWYVGSLVVVLACRDCYFVLGSRMKDSEEMCVNNFSNLIKPWS